MRRIRLRGEHVHPPLIVESLHQIRVAREAFGGGDLLDRVVFPQAVVGAKGAQSAFRADPGAGKDDDVAGFCHGAHEAYEGRDTQ